MRSMATDALRDFRAAIDAAAHTDRATFARRARNAAARAVVAASFDADVPAPKHPPPAADVRAHVGDELAALLLALYDGDKGWPSCAIDVLEPLHAIARG